jgi:hypothetical protein
VADTDENVRTYDEWAIRVHCDIAGRPGPHDLGPHPREAEARDRLLWWQENRPETRPELMHRTVTVIRPHWTVAAG